MCKSGRRCSFGDAQVVLPAPRRQNSRVADRCSCIVLGLLVIPPVVMYHPRLFIRNLFADRADAAFNAEVARRREEAQRSSAGG